MVAGDGIDVFYAIGTERIGATTEDTAGMDVSSPDRNFNIPVIASLEC